jgi:RNA polymerase sigma-70 factor, ECF subfamily
MPKRLISYFSGRMALSDEEAMLRVQREGDERAFALLVRRWQERIQRLCVRMVGDVHRGEDLAQEAFMRLYARRRSYRGEGKLSSYLWRIALNVCYDEQRRMSQQRENHAGSYEEDFTAESEPGASHDTPEAAAGKKEQAELVRMVLGRLPERHRTVLILRHYEGLKFCEIAEVIGIAEGTVKSRLAEALNRLGRLLQVALKEKTTVGVTTARANNRKLEVLL